jgi:GTP-binding protein SAR1
MFILEYFKGILNYLGLSKKTAKILFLGLDNAGVYFLLIRKQH